MKNNAKKILIVTEEENYPDSLKTYLELLFNVDVFITNDAMAAFKMLRAKPADILITGFNTKTLNGLKLTLAVKDQLKLDIPIFMTTSETVVSNTLLSLHYIKSALSNDYEMAELTVELNKLGILEERKLQTAAEPALAA